MALLEPDREIYPNAPLKLVAFELRFPLVPAFDKAESHEQLYARLRDEFPILGPPPLTQLEVDPGGARQRQRQRGMRLLNRQRTQTVALTDETVSIETSDYERFERLAALIDRVLAVVDEVGRLPGMQRIGLRYIDEITVPGVEGVEAWHDFIADDLLSAAKFHGYPTADYRSALSLRVSDDRLVTVRFGIVRDPVVDPGGPLRIAGTPQGEYFLLDIDSYWNASVDEFPEFDRRAALAICEELHHPIRSIFERAIKPKLRDEVLRVRTLNKRENDDR